MPDLLFDQDVRRESVLLPLPNSTSKNFIKSFYKQLSTYIFTKKPRYPIEIAFFSPHDDEAYTEMCELHRKNGGIHDRLYLLKMSESVEEFAESLPRFVVLAIEPTFYRYEEEHSILKTFTLSNCFKQLLREQNWNFREHPITTELKRKIQLIYEGYDEDEWQEAQYQKAEEKLEKRIILDVKNKIEYLLVYWKEFDYIKVIEKACEMFK